MQLFSLQDGEFSVYFNYSCKLLSIPSQEITRIVDEINERRRAYFSTAELGCGIPIHKILLAALWIHYQMICKPGLKRQFKHVDIRNET